MNYKLEHTRKIVALFFIIPVMVLIAAFAFIAINQNMSEKCFYFHTSLENPIGTTVENPEILTTKLNKNNNADKGALMPILVTAAFENAKMIAKTDASLRRLEGEQLWI